eukprot:403370668
MSRNQSFSKEDKTKSINKTNSQKYNQYFQDQSWPNAFMILVFHILFLSAIGVAFTPVLEANCETYTYPNSFMYLFLIQLIFSTFTLVYNHKKSYFREEIKDKLHTFEDNKQMKCFLRQIQGFARGNFIVSLIQLFWGLTGFFGVESSNFLECQQGGYRWMNMNMFGDLFPTLHVAAVIMHAVIVIIVFYRFPRRILVGEDVKGYFIEKEIIRERIGQEERKIELLKNFENNNENYLKQI